MIRTVMLLLLAVVAALAIWGLAVEPRLIDEERWAVAMPSAGEDWQGRRIAVIGDLQVGMWWDNTGTIRRVVERLTEQRPALVLLAGDFIYHPLGEPGGHMRREQFGAEARAEAAAVIRDSVGLLKPLVDQGIPTYAVLGNHDYGMQSRKAVRQDWIAQDLELALEEAGIPVLENEALPVTLQADTNSEHPPRLYVVGIGSHYAGYDHPREALDQVPEGAARLVLMHNPATFEKIPAGAAPLAFAGHTHGGQIAVPGTPGWSWMSLLNPGEVHADGWIRGYGAPGNRLYVNRGIGFSVIPVRIGAAPEITLVELRASPLDEAGSIREL